MICIKCGKEIEDTSKFCKFCGTPVVQELGFPLATDVFPRDTDSLNVALQSKDVKSDPNAEEGTHSKERDIPQDGSFDRFGVVVGKNAQYYISEFEKASKGQKTKFNWAAFFFGTFLCFYRKCNKLFCKYYLFPLGIYLVGITVTNIGLATMSQQAALAGCAIALIGSIWGFVNAIRFGRNFNTEYHRHCLSMLETGDTKKYGTSIGYVVLTFAGVFGLSILTSLPYLLANNNPAPWGGAPTPGLAQAWGLIDSPQEPTGVFDLAPNPYYTEADAYDYNDLIDVLSDYGSAKAFHEKYSGTDTQICIYNVRLQTHDEISVYDPTTLLRLRLSDETTEGKTFYTEHDYMVVGSMNVFSFATDYSYHQVELAGCEIYEVWNGSMFTDASLSNITYMDFVGEFLGDDKDFDALYIELSGSALDIACYGYREEHFNATVDVSTNQVSDTISFQASDPYTNSTYAVNLTYVPAANSPYDKDTIFMRAPGLFNMTYTRSDGYYDSGFSGNYPSENDFQNAVMQMVNMWCDDPNKAVSDFKDSVELLSYDYMWGDDYNTEVRFVLFATVRINVPTENGSIWSEDADIVGSAWWDGNRFTSISYAS